MKFILKNIRKTVLITVLKVLLSIGLLVYMVQKADPASIFRTMTTVKIDYYLLAIAVFLISQPLKTLRWGAFLKEKKVFISQLKLIKLYFIGMFFNTFLPTVLAGDAVRTYYIHKEYNSKEIPATSVIVERFCGLFSLFFIGLISSMYWLIKLDPLPFITTGFSLCLAAVIGMMLLISSSFHKMILKALKALNIKPFWDGSEKLYYSFQGYTKNIKVLLTGFLLSLLASVATIIMGYCLSLSLSWEIPFYVFLYTIPIITVSAILPVSFGGVGVRESAFFIIFSKYGVAGSSAVTLGLLWYSINLISGIIGGICYASYSAKPPLRKMTKGLL